MIQHAIAVGLSLAVLGALPARAGQQDRSAQPTCGDDEGKKGTKHGFQHQCGDDEGKKGSNQNSPDQR